VQILNEDDLRDCFAMFALIGVKTTSNYEEQAKWCYEMADAMMEARKTKDEAGIASVKRTRKVK
jgi:hypothetical protein